MYMYTNAVKKDVRIWRLFLSIFKNHVNLTVQKMESDNFSKKNGILSVLHTHFVSSSLSLTVS